MIKDYLLNLIGISLFLFPSSGLFCQLVSQPLGTNPSLQAFASPDIGASLRSDEDTLNLPFIEDFSYAGPLPDETKWIDGGVFINSEFPINPPSWGVATFDGLNKSGLPYNNSKVHGEADTLTSKPINLKAQPSDSVYLSFFIQPKGRGNFPEYIDTLLLEFKSPSDTLWKWVWSARGEDFPQKEKPFKVVLIPIKDSLFLKKGFQFRFRNYAQLNGSWDHWHLDYIRLDKGRSRFDTNYTDYAFMYRGKSLLKTYQSVPLNHFFVLPVNNMSKTYNMSLTNNTANPTNVFYGYSFYNQFGVNVDLLSNKTKGPLPSRQEFIITEPTKFTYLNPGPQYEYATFMLYHMLNDNPTDLIPRNDTTFYFQILSNYYALDDGSAEERIGFENASGGFIAQRFETITGDTLKAIQLFFNKVQDGISDRPFYLMIWQAGNNQPGDLILSEGPFQPKEKGWNKYVSYALENPVYLPSGTYYFGFAQQTEASLNLGFDRNINSNERIFYNQSGTWYNYSAQEGTLMIRPMFRKSEDTYVSIKNSASVLLADNWRVYPNPVSDLCSISLPKRSHYQIELTDLSGRLVLEDHLYSDTFSFLVNHLPQGGYFVKVFDKDNGHSSFRQLIITHK